MRLASDDEAANPTRPGPFAAVIIRMEEAFCCPAPHASATKSQPRPPRPSPSRPAATGLSGPLQRAPLARAQSILVRREVAAMPEPASSTREAAVRIGVSETGIHKAERAGR